MLKNSKKTKKESKKLGSPALLEDKQEHLESRFLDKTSLLAILINGLLLVGLVFLGVIYYKDKTAGKESLTVTTASSPITTPTPTKAEEINISEYKLRILNGSGIPGEAGRVAKTLEETGFENIETADASSYDYADTEVQMKKEVPGLLYEKIKETLTDYNVTRADSLDEDSQYDVVVIVGTKT